MDKGLKMSKKDSQVISQNPYVLIFKTAEQKFNDGNIVEAMEFYKSAILLTDNSADNTLCHLKLLTCNILQEKIIANPSEYLIQLKIFANSDSKEIELQRLKALSILDSRSVVDLEEDLNEIRAKIFSNEPLPRNAIPYGRSLAASGQPAKAIELLMAFKDWNLPKRTAFDRLVLLGSCYDLLEDLDKSLYFYNQAIQSTNQPPAWLSGKIKSLMYLAGKPVESDLLPVDIYHRTSIADATVVTELEQQAQGLTEFQIAPYLSAIVTFKGDAAAISCAEKLFHDKNLTNNARCWALNFLLPYASNTLIEQVDIPHQYAFIELALIKYQSREEFAEWLKQCPGQPGGDRKILAHKIIASSQYYGGVNACSFNGESSIYRPKTDAKKLLIITCGLHGDIFYKPESIAYFLEDKDFSVLWLNDKSGNNFLNGIESFGQNPIQFISKLSDFIRDNHYQEVACLGASAGGAAAAFIGFTLGIKEVVGLSAATYIKRDDEVHAINIAETFLPHLVSKDFCLKTIYSNKKKPKLDLYYGDKSKPDCMYAKHMEGVKGVQMHPLNGWRHHAITAELIRIGKFEEIISGLFRA